ncbi:hypothetical protein N7444_003436 [Penicillium canescens]|nr:hypothetical protein N7444_003436 [Penicillium canescens]
MAAPKPSIAKVTIIFGDNSVYHRALKTHEEHSRKFGYPMHVLQSGILDDVWTKPAFLLSLILEELVKPKTERLEWIFWFDADTVVMNPNIPIELFLPPADFPDIHVIFSKDWNGLNNGVFPIRVHPWSVELLSAVIAYPHYFPNTQLVFRDQSALGKLLENDDYFRNSTIYAPLRWFNAYRGAPDGSLNDYIPPEFQLRKGDFLVHFAGTSASDRNNSIGSGGIGGGGAGVFRLAFTLARSSAGIGFLAAFLPSDIAFFSA